MSYDATGLDRQFVHPGSAGPSGFAYTKRQPATERAARPATSPPHRQNHRHSRASAPRRRLRSRRFLPVILALVAALVFVTLTEGGSKARSARPITSHLGQMLDFVGLGLTEVTVRGQLMTRDGEIYDRLQLTGLRSIWLLDVEAARRRIETLPWVQKASLKRVFPDRLLVEIQERTPRAIWSDGRTAHLIDAAGRLLGPPVPGRFARLPSIFGAGAAPNADAILTATEGLAGLGGKVVVFEWTANRRWTLHLAAGRRILLPATGQALALEQLTRGKPGQRLLDSRFSKLDMRVASQAAIEFLE